MTLKIVLKPGERLYLGTSQISIESESLAKIHIDGDVPVMREKDYLPAGKAGTLARRIYFALQSAYLQEDFAQYRDEYFRLTGELMSSKPECVPFLSQINESIAAQKLYSALKAAIKLVQFDDGHLGEGARSAQWDGF